MTCGPITKTPPHETIEPVTKRFREASRVHSDQAQDKTSLYRRDRDRDAPLGLAQLDGAGPGLSPRTSPRPTCNAAPITSDATGHLLPNICRELEESGVQTRSTATVSLQTDWGRSE